MAAYHSGSEVSRTVVNTDRHSSFRFFRGSRLMLRCRTVTREKDRNPCGNTARNVKPFSTDHLHPCFMSFSPAKPVDYLRVSEKAEPALVNHRNAGSALLSKIQRYTSLPQVTATPDVVATKPLHPGYGCGPVGPPCSCCASSPAT